MRRLILCLVIALGDGTAAAQHQHGSQAAKAPEPFTASPAFAPDGSLWLVRPVVDRIVAMRSTDLGKTFSAPVSITPEPMNLDWGPDARARIVFDPRGNIVVTFGTFQDRNFNGRAYFARSTDGGASFGPPRPITADTTSQRFEVAAVDPRGRVFATWLDKRNGPAARAAPIPVRRSPSPGRTARRGSARPRSRSTIPANAVASASRSTGPASPPWCSATSSPARSATTRS